MSSQHLLEAKLRGLVRSLTGAEIELRNAPGGPGGIVASGPEAGRAFLLAPEGDPGRAIGPALLWVDKLGQSVEIVADAEISSELARRATPFGSVLRIWGAEGTSLTESVAAAPLIPPELGADVMAFVEVIEAGGGRPVDDHGRLVAEYEGLEVARVSHDLDGVAQLEVGVGQADRELQQLVHGQLGRPEALGRAIEMVAEHRRPGAPMHPLNRLARERWLRSLILADPSLVELSSADPIPPLRPRSTLLGTVAIASVGHRTDGTHVVAVCFVGIDTDLVPEAADYRVREIESRRLQGIDPVEVEIVVVVPERDHHALLDRQADHTHGVTVMSIPEPWALSDS